MIVSIFRKTVRAIQDPGFKHTTVFAQRTSAGLERTGNERGRFCCTCPAILPFVELGFINSSADRKILSSENGRRDIARNLFKGFEQYMNSYAGNGKSAVSDYTVPSPKSFLVLIIASADKIQPSAPVLKSYPQAGYILCEGQRFMYKYTLGNFETREDAQKYCNELRDGPFPDAFVIAVKDGQLVPF